MKSPGVLIEGNSFTQFVQTDHFVMVRRAGDDKMKTSARRTIDKVTAVYVSDTEISLPPETIPVFTPSRLPDLIDYLRGS